MSPSTWKAAALLAAAFVGGGVAGGAAVAAAERGKPAGANCAGTHDWGPQGYLERLTTDLALTPVQQDSVRAILERHRPSMDSLWREAGPRLEALRTAIRSEIRTQLSPEQQRAYSEMIARHDSAHWRRAR